MSFLGTGLLGGALGTMLGAALDTVLSDNDVLTKPIPTFYFAVEMYDKQENYKPEREVDKDFGGGNSLGGNLLSAAQGMVGMGKDSLTMDPIADWINSAFIEVSGLEMSVDSETRNEGGYNYPIDIPTRLKNPHVTLKRLYRPINTNKKKDKWTKWIEETFTAMAYWKTPIELKIIQITIFHPNMDGSSGKPYVLYTTTLYDAYPVKQTFGTFNSTSEDLMTEEIEISYSNMQGAYGTVKESSPMGT